MNESMIVAPGSVQSSAPAAITSDEFATMLREVQEQPAWRRNADVTKVCSKCGTTKPLSAFAPHQGCKHGVRPDCRECMNGLLRDWKKQYRKRPHVAEQESAYRKSEARKESLKAHATTERFKSTQKKWIA